eukprot:Gb_15900 [translate_table: standard]
MLKMERFSAFTEQLAKEGNDNAGRLKIHAEGAIIIGAGPSGMATAACLVNLGISSTIIEKEYCIAPLWQHGTYDRLRLHIGKNFCDLPLVSFPEDYPTFVTRKQFVEYLEAYAKKFNIQPRFRQAVESAEFCQETGNWHVFTRGCADCQEREYVGRFLVVATGENGEVFVPDVPGLESFKGSVVHSSAYKDGLAYKDKKVLVVGCGNSGMEIALDLANNNAKTSIVVRSSLHVLPREIFGRSIFSVAMQLTKLLPVGIVDYLLVLCSKLTLGDTVAYGIPRPIQGPLELKNKLGKTPVLDVGTVAKIRSGDIKVVPNLNRITATGVEFENGHVQEFDAIIFATGYRSTVPTWLKDADDFFSKEGFPRMPFPNNWKGKNGLYAAGLGRRGLSGSSLDAHRIAQDISKAYNRSP